MANESSENRGSSRIISATWAQEPSLSNVLNLFYDPPTEVDGERADKLAEEEFHALQALKGDRSFHRSELIFDVKGIVFLANLHHSLVRETIVALGAKLIRYRQRWFNEQVNLMRRPHQSGRVSLIYRLPSSRSQTAFWRLQHLLGTQPTLRQRILDIPADSVTCVQFGLIPTCLGVDGITCFQSL